MFACFYDYWQKIKVYIIAARSIIPLHPFRIWEITIYCAAEQQVIRRLD